MSRYAGRFARREEDQKIPFYYDVNRPTTTNGTTLTESEHLRALTVANQLTARLMALYGTARFGTAGGASLRVKTASTPGSGGTSQTPGKRNPSAPAASTTWFNDASALTPGTTLTVRAAVGLAQTGNNPVWTPVELDDAIALSANGGAGGNLEIYSIAVGVSVPIDITPEFQEN